VENLWQEKLITGKHLIMGSSPILTKLREDNLKLFTSKRFDKNRISS